MSTLIGRLIERESIGTNMAIRPNRLGLFSGSDFNSELPDPIKEIEEHTPSPSKPHLRPEQQHRPGDTPVASPSTPATWEALFRKIEQPEIETEQSAKNIEVKKQIRPSTQRSLGQLSPELPTDEGTADNRPLDADPSSETLPHQTQQRSKPVPPHVTEHFSIQSEKKPTTPRSSLSEEPKSHPERKSSRQQLDKEGENLSQLVRPPKETARKEPPRPPAQPIPVKSQRPRPLIDGPPSSRHQHRPIEISIGTIEIRATPPPSPRPVMPPPQPARAQPQIETISPLESYYKKRMEELS